MLIIMRILVLAGLLAMAATVAAARPFDVEDLVRLARVSDPQVAPDGRAVVYVLRETDIEGNRGLNGIWLARTDGAAEPVRLTAPTASAWHPRWAPDGSALYFLSTRNGSAQVWRLPLAQPGEARPVTGYPLAVNAFAVSPAGDQLALGIDVFLDCDSLACTRERLDERAADPATGAVFDRTFVRHWDSWKDGRRGQLFLAELDADGQAGAPRRVSVGLDADIPTRPFGSAGEWAFSPEGDDLVFVARVEPAGEPWSTNTDLYRVATRGEAQPENLTPDNPAYDNSPVFSPDGRYLAWLAMSRPGFEADRNRILLRDLRSGATREVAPDWDRSAHGLAFSPDGRRLYTWADDLGHRRLFGVDVRSGRVDALSGDGSVAGFGIGPGVAVFARQHLASPAQLFAVDLRGRGERQLTGHNGALLEEVAFGAYEQFSFPGAGGRTVYGWVVKPAAFEPGQRYPVAFIVHGGPQGSMGNSFHYRWNPQTYAGKGYAVVFIDFHGSTGYGQDFTDSITGDWGGKPLEDLRLGWSAALERYDFLDGERACALGASYGGYMINWIAGAWADGFDCLVNHSGIFDNRSMYYSTEELWFPEWEMGGPQFVAPQGFERHNPVNLVAGWETPMLVIHGALDFRVPLEQGLATFNALQRRGIPSRFLYFPDENHWILKPANSVQWHRVVEDWLDRWIGAGAAQD
ncbi:S9 family peptidase [Thioalkalivibrio sp. XN8]|uniref:alpha/beta hydrolase family protein n=1 Tax=Thioalkalivibrio sp. XN8 TaxID=2712863 RepID=UPI00197D6C5E|nr:S9 family peptidase [Thioalkalivibrio sp. XN8]